MTFRSYHGEFPPDKDIYSSVGKFAGSRRSFKTSRFVRNSSSGHIDKQSYGGGWEEWGGVGM